MLLLFAAATALKGQEPQPLPRWTVPTDDAGLDTHPGTTSARFPPLDLRWGAREMVAASEAVRARIRVPFYVYDFPELQLVSVIEAYAACDARHEVTSKSFMYGGDLYFLQQLAGHPWRVHKRASAAFLVLPIALSLDGPCGTASQSARVIELAAQGREWAERRQDHLYLHMQHRWLYSTELPGFPHVLGVSLEAGLFSHRQHGLRPQLLAPYADMRSGLAHLTGEAARRVRNVTFFYGGQTHAYGTKQARWGYELRQRLRMRRRELLDHPGLPRSLVFVDSSPAEWEHCLARCAPQMDWRAVTRVACQGLADFSALTARAEFVLSPRGDTVGSQRTYQAIESGAINVFIAEGTARTSLPFQCLVPWEHFSLEIDEKGAGCALGAALEHVLRAWPAARRERARELMAHYARDLLWHAPGSRVAENVLIEAAFLRGLPLERQIRHAATPDVPCAFRNRLRYHPSTMRGPLSRVHKSPRMYIRKREGKSQWRFTASWDPVPDNCSAHAAALPVPAELPRNARKQCSAAEAAVRRREQDDSEIQF